MRTIKFGAVTWLASLAVLLGVLCIWLASGVGSEPSWLTPGTSTTPAALDQQNPMQPQSVVEVNTLSHVWRTPLFSPSRSPDVVQRSAEPGLDLGGLKLTGIVIADGVRQALFRQADGKDLALREGAALGGWRLRHIEEQAVQFELDGRSQRLRLPAPRLPNMNSAPPVPPARPIHPPQASEGR
ncbi:hypothetical protein TRP66_17525 [Pseudomonas sp. JDS28PS106]|uniref:hypothetical protein n=1 Tax=Pseudomonas sp. JDS28PS106 TaxID=2497235 RepID=UPI002FD2D420